MSSSCLHCTPTCAEGTQQKISSFIFRGFFPGNFSKHPFSELPLDATLFMRAARARAFLDGVPEDKQPMAAVAREPRDVLYRVERHPCLFSNFFVDHLLFSFMPVSLVSASTTFDNSSISFVPLSWSTICSILTRQGTHVNAFRNSGRPQCHMISFYDHDEKLPVSREQVKPGPRRPHSP